MKKLLSLLCAISLYSCAAFANDSCFIAAENGKTFIKEGDCSTAYGPQSTFKIALSLIGFDSGILKDKNSPTWSMPDGADPYINVCKVDHNPRTWMRDSCLWYSNILTSKLGMKKFEEYVKQFSYGNMDISAGLVSSWVSSSLKISPEGQVQFLQKLVDRKLHLSKESYDKAKNIMFIQELAGGWKLYGKTGNGAKIDNNGNKTKMQQGWFVGYIEKGNRSIVFAKHIVDSKEEKTFASMRARNEALLKFHDIINGIEK